MPLDRGGKRLQLPGREVPRANQLKSSVAQVCFLPGLDQIRGSFSDRALTGIYESEWSRRTLDFAGAPKFRIHAIAGPSGSLVREMLFNGSFRETAWDQHQVRQRQLGALLLWADEVGQRLLVIGDPISIFFNEPTFGLLP